MIPFHLTSEIRHTCAMQAKRVVHELGLSDAEAPALLVVAGLLVGVYARITRCTIDQAMVTVRQMADDFSALSRPLP